MVSADTLFVVLKDREIKQTDQIACRGKAVPQAKTSGNKPIFHLMSDPTAKIRTDCKATKTVREQ